MEPNEPIRERKTFLPPTDGYFARPQRRATSYIGDFVMCWLALCGLLNAAAGAAFFTDKKMQFRLFEQWLESPAQRMEWIGFYSAMSVVGFTYMLWRYRWRYRLSTLFKIAVLWCVALAALKTTPISMAVFGILAFGYTVIWSCRSKGSPE
jgi:hypothetical protein